MSKLFSDLGISLALQQGLSDLNITEPTYIQQKAIPILLKQSEDVVALAKTGTGKTAAFGLPLLDLIDVESKHIQVVILAPTRELGQQIHNNLEGYAKHLPLVSIASVCGGIPIKPQIERLKTPTQIVVATPGRLLDLVGREAIQLNKLSYLVLDEADEMVNNFQQELESIIKEIPKKRRTLLFTATLSGAVKQLVQNYMSKHVVQIEDHTNGSVNLGIDHHYTVVTPIEKLDVLMHFLSARTGQRGLIFCKTKAAVNKLGKNLAINKFSSGLIHGSLTQGIRDRIMGQFREGHIDILVATDLAARGIDVQEISYVVHYHLPDTYDTYVHRSGRTARAGAKGFSLSILQEEELKDIPEFEKELGIKFNEFKKGDAQSIEENNGLLWAKKIFKTKPNHEISPSFREQIGTVFHHLTKEELIDKLLADYVNTTKTLRTKEAPVKRLKKR
ncbi:MAG: DEAD/DEAH box helicase [Flavobacteriaceae bacterium]|jgi:ATP-dependent RNA helicase DeaD|nr:DEAD/DEAH box helicase [Flavobacteriaceae bacterium]NQV63381.1 DEAD/DEAH box helicase [Cryomorphaceae bacterium]MBT5393721.1 DEAD/DEAH box helicase [Flavobacteriaceae bacterium]MBT5585042.1 DEAD/DEAH box helicase [Flavobacteriaceae bacterium]MDA8931733.1 DEAD/DEAH box helicase [Flavobacteriaceae bacterium]|tara:strand:- start:719 stop:2059 length:1341 start_codon:yes stop_codon:yes gene_type:complete